MKATDVHQVKHKISNRRIIQLASKSQQIIKKYQSHDGAYPASPNFSTYNYSWFRDSAFIAYAMSLYGEIDSVEQYFQWTSDIIVARREQILSGDVLETRYTLDGQEVSGEWATLQHDGFGLWLWVLRCHVEMHNRPTELFQEAAGLLQHYLAVHWQEPCFDWWEEQKGMHAATLACIYAGLRSFDHPEASNVKSAIHLSDERLDSSLLICSIVEAVDQQMFQETFAQIEKQLVGQNGGVYRYRADTYYGGGQWPVLTGLLGWYYIKTGKHNEAKAKVDWIASQFDKNGWLPEQVQDKLLHSEQYAPWVEKWGPPANPLLWSHAMFLIIVHKLKSESEN